LADAGLLIEVEDIKSKITLYSVASLRVVMGISRSGVPLIRLPGLI
jgi:hypothetical protein